MATGRRRQDWDVSGVGALIDVGRRSWASAGALRRAGQGIGVATVVDTGGRLGEAGQVDYWDGRVLARGRSQGCRSRAVHRR
jgi:hypothetical protein